MKALSMRVLRIFAVCAMAVLAACAATYQNHGYVPPESDLENLVIGVDSRTTVDDLIGPPSVAGMVGDGDYYYVRSRKRTFMMLRPEVIEREVVAISFDETDTVANVERFGLEDGQIVPLSRRVTETSVVKSGFLQQLLRNIGAINPVDAFGS